MLAKTKSWATANGQFVKRAGHHARIESIGLGCLARQHCWASCSHRLYWAVLLSQSHGTIALQCSKPKYKRVHSSPDGPDSLSEVTTNEAEFHGPGTGRTPETSQLRAFKRTGEAPKMIVVKRNDEVAVLQVGSDSQTIKTHGLYIPVEPGTVRGSVGLVKRLRTADRIHLCRNEACTEEGGEHFTTYGLVRQSNPEVFQMNQAKQGARSATKQLWAWITGPRATEATMQVMQRIKELGSESEQEEEVLSCAASRVTWLGSEGGPSYLAPRPCEAKAAHFEQVLTEDIPIGCTKFALCPSHSTKYMVERYKDKCSVNTCRRFGSKFQHGVMWCAEHEPRTAQRPSTPPSRRSRSRSRGKVYVVEDEEPEDVMQEQDGEDDEEPPHDLLRRVQEIGEARNSKSRRTSRSPGHTPKSSAISRNLSKMGMLSSPGSEAAPGLLEEFFDKFAAGKSDGLREHQVRARLSEERMMDKEELLKNLIAEGELEQAQGQKGLTRFLTTWRAELKRAEQVGQESEASAWSVIDGGGLRPTPLSSTGPSSPPLGWAALLLCS